MKTRKVVFLLTIILIFPLPVYSQNSNISIKNNNEISINYQNITKHSQSKILAQLVIDDILKQAEKLTENGNYLDASRLLASVTYLDHTNIYAQQKGASYLTMLIENEGDREKLYKNFLTEAKHGLRKTNSIHRLQVAMSLMMAKEARSLYSEGSENYKKANMFIEEHGKYGAKEIPTKEIKSKIKKEANSALKSGNYIRAINKYSILFYIENSASHLIQISKIIKNT